MFAWFGLDDCPHCDNPHYDGDYCDECGYDPWDDFDDPWDDDYPDW